MNHTNLRTAIIEWFKNHDQDGIRAGYGPGMMAPIDFLYTELPSYNPPDILEVCEQLADEGYLVRDDEPDRPDGEPIPHFATKEHSA